jgi:hypothetical protein
VSDSHTGRLENWQFVHDRIYGQVYDDVHKRFEDGAMIYTSSVKNNDTESLDEGHVAVTRNSTYLLGKKFQPAAKKES